MAPENITPSPTARIVRFLPRPSTHAPMVPVHAPVTGKGMATKRGEAPEAVNVQLWLQLYDWHEQSGSQKFCGKIPSYSKNGVQY